MSYRPSHLGANKAADGETVPRTEMPRRHRDVLTEVAERYSITPAEMLTGRRWVASYARHEFFHRVRTGDRPPSFPLIASWFGFDHTTVLHGVREHARKMAR